MNRRRSVKGSREGSSRPHGTDAAGASPSSPARSRRTAALGIAAFGLTLVVAGGRSGARAAEPTAERHSGQAASAPVRPAGLTLPRAGLAAVRVAVAPVLDGRLDDPSWKASVGVSDFVQQAPNEGSPPSERTTLRILYDDEAVYLGFDCNQVTTPIVGRLTRRDQDSESDWVWFEVDSRRDGRTAGLFAVNVAGVMTDGMFRETATGPSISMDWDEIWEARTARTPGGWSAEVRIPLRILRFSPDLPVQSWGFAAFRFIGVRQETDSWPAIPREAPSAFAYFGRIENLQHLKAGEELELRPFALGQVRRLDADPSIAASGFDQGVSAGLDLKLHLTPSMTFDGAVNPDFAQVEVDQIIFNLGRYEILLPEKRPLFLEGADQFSTPLALFYSRRIGSSPLKPTLQAAMGTSAERLVNVPEAATLYGAAKMIGRVGETWTIGALSVLAARNEYQVVPATGGAAVSRTAEPLTMFNVLRLRRDVGTSAQIGLIGTATSRFEQTGPMGRVCPSGDVVSVSGANRCFRDAYTGGVDGIWRPWGGNYVASAQLVGGIVEHGTPQTQLDGTKIESGNGGLGAWVRLAKDGGRPVLADVTYTGLGRRLTFNDLGFMLRQNLHEVKAGLELRSLTPGPLTLERHLRLDVTTRRDLRGLDLGTVVELGAAMRLRSFWSVRLAAEGAPAYFDDLEIGTGAALERGGFAGGKLELYTDPRRKVAVSLKSEVRFLSSGTSVDAQATLTMQPLPHIEVAVTPEVVRSDGEPRYAWQSATSDTFGRLHARSAGATLRASYTFTPRLTLQAYGQLFLGAWHYTDFATEGTAPGARIRLSQLLPELGTAAGPTDADYEQAALNVQVVLRWEYRLGSTLFLVYSRSQAPEVNLQGPAALRVGDIRNVPAADMVLLKLSLWWAT